MARSCTFRIAATDGPVDWDGDGLATATSTTADLNPEDHPGAGCGGAVQVLRGYTDWGPAPGESIFTYGFQCTPFGAD